MTTENPQALLYGGTDLDPARLSGIVTDVLSGTDDGELYVQNAVTESFAFDDGRLKNAAYDHMRGFGLRGCDDWSRSAYLRLAPIITVEVAISKIAQNQCGRNNASSI